MGGSNKIVRVHDLLTHEQAYEFKEHDDWITALVFSPDTTLLASADRRGNLFVLEAETGRIVHILTDHEDAICDLAFRADSEVLASAGADGIVRLWDMRDGKKSRQFKAHQGAVLSVDFAPDGRLCSSGSDGAVSLWNPNGSKLRDLRRYDDWAYQACFAMQGRRVIAGSWAGVVEVFDSAGGESLWQFDTYPQAVQSAVERNYPAPARLPPYGARHRNARIPATLNAPARADRS